MLTPQQLFARLDDLGLAHTTVEHAPVHTVEEAKQHRGVLPGHHIKNLFLRNKKEAMWLVVAIEDRAIDLKQLGERLGAGRLSFGSPERLRTYLGESGLKTGGPVNAHPLTNTMTTAISTADLLRFFEATGHQPDWLDFPAG